MSKLEAKTRLLTKFDLKRPKLGQKKQNPNMLTEMLDIMFITLWKIRVI